MKGSITRRGKDSWRLKFDVGRDVSGKRQTRYLTFRGKRAEAERELAKQLHTFHEGTAVEPNKVTVAEYLFAWLATRTKIDRAEPLAPKTIERYAQIAEQQIVPHLGSLLLQKLRPADVADWHLKLLARGGKRGGPLSARTVGHAHRLLHGVLQRACRAEIVARNVAAAHKAPKPTRVEVEILGERDVPNVLAALVGHPLCSIVSVALGTGMRRGELLGLQWADVDLEAAVLRVERSLEQTRAGLRLKPPKTEAGRRVISLPSSAVEILREHRRAQLEQRMALGLGRDQADALVFSNPLGDPLPPNDVSRDWTRAVKAKKLPGVSFHALRHTHASALIASGLDVVTISRRLGHGSPSVTLTVYAHLFKKTDTAAADAIDRVLRG
jgi:integrase